MRLSFRAGAHNRQRVQRCHLFLHSGQIRLCFGTLGVVGLHRRKFCAQVGALAFEIFDGVRDVAAGRTELRRGRKSDPCDLKNREHQKDGEQKQAHRANEGCAFAFYVATGKLAGLQRQLRQGLPGFAFEVQGAMQKIMQEGAQRPVQMRFLAAGVAIVARQRCSAIEACPFVEVASLQLCSFWQALASAAHGLGEKAAFDCSPECVAELAHMPSCPVAG